MEALFFFLKKKVVEWFFFQEIDTSPSPEVSQPRNGALWVPWWVGGGGEGP
jgi:hypothetical protein